MTEAKELLRGIKPDETIQEKQERFLPLILRTADIVLAVEAMTAAADNEVETRDVNGYPNTPQFRRKVVVSLGQQAVTDEKPNHYRLCGVTYVADRPLSERHLLTARAEFAFAVAPLEKVRHFMDDPHDLHNPELDATNRYTAYGVATD